MRRRALLAAFGSTTALTAGCLNRGGGEPTADTTATDDPTATPTDTTEPTDEPTDGPGGTPRDPLSGVPCPSFAEGVDRTVCWPHGDLSDEPLYLDASSVVFEPTADDGEVASLEFVLHNGSEQSFGLNPHDWAIWRRTEDDWSFVAPEEHVEPWYTVESGETYTWRLTVQQHPAPMSGDTLAVVQDLADGVYAFQVTGAYGDGPNDGTQVECIALFAVRRQE
ncbi:hypothetical protein [Halorientalis marina]|uniref:hypothetical protein n=1 Tax=Halorientalis marina TaxID=2931976 RepID=UPI001FF65FD8|nr:hypothetical protein [Halorientalis marina]